MELTEIFDTVESVAIVGASPKTWKIGGTILKNLIDHGFQGRIYPVNPRYERIHGLSSYPSLGALPETPDIVAIAVSSKQAVKALEESSKLGVKLAVVFTSGDREFTNKLGLISRHTGLRILGPNSAGVIVAKKKLYLTIEYSAAPGHVAVISQSGALGGVAMHWLSMLSSGVSFFLSLGNMSDIGLHEALRYAASDEETEAVSAYIEWVKNGAAYMNALRTLASLGKPVCIVKGGHGPRSVDAIQSHTGGVATDYRVFAAATRQAGGYVVKDMGTSVSLCELKRRFPRLGKRALIVTNSGGLGVLIASRLEELGYSLPRLTRDLAELVKRVKPKGVTGNNPIDLQGDATIAQLVDAVRVLSNASLSDFIILGYVPTSAESPGMVCKELVRLRDAEKPVILVAEGYGSLDIVKCSSNTVLSIPGVSMLAEILRYY